MKILQRLGLQFADPEMESEFREAYALRNLTLDRLALASAGGLFYAFFLWDRAIDPKNWEIGHAIRGLIMLPVLCGAAVALGIGSVQKHIETIIAALGIACVFALSIIYSLLSHGFDYSVVGPLLVGIWVFSVFQIRLMYLVAFSILSGIAYFSVHVIADNARPGMMLVNALSVVPGFSLGLWAAAFREVSHRKQFLTLRELADAHERVEELLHSMLPSEIVQRIQAGETAIADSYGEVSIVFADLVGFTELSRRISPGHLVEILNRFFSEFDSRADCHGLERIKTIGDAYMAVGGLDRTGRGGDHARAAASFALELQTVVKKLGVELGYTIHARVGLHIGPVVAGVIGTKRPAFDCWGEAVNLASRLEGVAGPGSVIISESAYWRLKTHFPIAVLDDVDLKGIGPTKIYLLESPATT